MNIINDIAQSYGSLRHGALLLIFQKNVLSQDNKFAPRHRNMDTCKYWNIKSLKNYFDEKSDAQKFRPRFGLSSNFLAFNFCP